MGGESPNAGAGDVARSGAARANRYGPPTRKAIARQTPDEQWHDAIDSRGPKPVTRSDNHLPLNNVRVGPAKGSLTFTDHLQKYQRAHAAGFAMETDYVLGADSYEEMLSGVAELDAAQVVVVANIKRNYSTVQLNSNHDDMWDLGAQYIAEGFEACVATYAHGTIKRRAARLSLDYLALNSWAWP